MIEKKINLDSSWSGVVKWGGLSLFTAGLILVLFILLVFITQQTLPLLAREALENPLFPTILFSLAALGEFFLLPGGLGLYFSLSNIKKTPMFIATAMWLLAAPMFLASRGLIVSLSQISDRYLDTTSETMKTAYLASAELAIETQNIYAMMALSLLSVATIMIGRVMLKGEFGGYMGYIAIIAGALTIFSPFGVIWGIPIIIPFIGLILTAVWQIVIGFKLYKLGKNV
jgi:hypothetical protein